MKNQRIEAYITLAATPAVIGGIANADVYHYDGPSISITTNGLPSDESMFDTSHFAFGGGSMQVMIDMRVGAFSDSGDESYARFAKVRAGVDKPKGAPIGGGIINSNNPQVSSKSAQRFSYSNKIPGKNTPKANGFVGGSTTKNSERIEMGNFNGEGEERGYIGVFLETGDSAGFGWLDIGYDFTSNTLTMYDWAFNDDGLLNAGHLTPPGGVVPGPAGLLALAAAAAGIRRKRNRVT
jgi:hypothetical protein